MIISALYGACAMGCLAVAVIFLRHWRRSLDALFAAFAAAFGILAIDYGVLALAMVGAEWRPYVYGVRLVAFGLIIAGIVQKNRQTNGG
jgi:hypothetical protein